LQNVGNTFNKLVITFAPIEQDLEFWNSFEGSSILNNMMSKYEKGLSIVTQIGGREYSNLTNCNETFSISYPNVVSNPAFKIERSTFWVTAFNCVSPSIMFLILA
jgi:hypothetical protein